MSPKIIAKVVRRAPVLKQLHAVQGGSTLPISHSQLKPEFLQVIAVAIFRLKNFCFDRSSSKP
jgi:hypothetical protein